MVQHESHSGTHLTTGLSHLESDAVWSVPHIVRRMMSHFSQARLPLLTSVAMGRGGARFLVEDVCWWATDQHEKAQHVGGRKARDPPQGHVICCKGRCPVLFGRGTVALETFFEFCQNQSKQQRNQWVLETRDPFDTRSKTCGWHANNFLGVEGLFSQLSPHREDALIWISKRVSMILVGSPRMDIVSHKDFRIHVAQIDSRKKNRGEARKIHLVLSNLCT